MDRRQDHYPIDFALIVLAIVYNLGLMGFSTLWIFTNAFQNLKTGLREVEHLQINEMLSFSLFLAGVLGGTFYCLRAIYQRIGEAYTPIDGMGDRLYPNYSLDIRAWFFWYLYRPLQAGVLALVLIALLKSDLLLLEDLSSSDFESYFVVVGLGFLTGFGSHEVIHKILELVKVIFAKSNIKSSNSKEKVKENNGQ